MEGAAWPSGQYLSWRETTEVWGTSPDGAGPAEHDGVLPRPLFRGLHGDQRGARDLADLVVSSDVGSCFPLLPGS